MKFGKDGFCECDCATTCPLGKMGCAPRCTKSEVEKFESKKESTMTPAQTALMQAQTEKLENCAEIIALMFESLERIATGKTKDPAKDAFDTIKCCGMMIERGDTKCRS